MKQSRALHQGGIADPQDQEPKPYSSRIQGMSPSNPSIHEPTVIGSMAKTRCV